MKRSKHSLSHYHLTTFDMGQLIPLTWQEVLPGDMFRMRTSMLLRKSPMVAPIMHPMLVKVHHWFVPLRLIWEDFEDFITRGPDGTSAPVHPRFDNKTVVEGDLHSYFGVPAHAYGVGDYFSALPVRAYNLIYNEMYRDQDLVTELTNSVASGTDVTSATAVQTVAWEKDYFTTARPWESKGDSVNIPLVGEAYVKGIAASNNNWTAGPSGGLYESGESATRTFADYKWIDATTTGNHSWNIEKDASASYPNIRADLSTSTGVDMIDFRLALGLQRMQELRARYGSRYVEWLRSMGVRSSDARLQLPEYLGGGRQVIQVSEVLSTDSGGADPVGDMKGHGIAALRSNRFRRYFEEHGVIITLASVLPKAIYTQGLARKWSRESYADYFQKELQHVGEQEIYNKEVYAPHTTPDGIFGYGGRYDEYRYHPSYISGEFLSTLDHWHAGRVFGADPALNATFINAVPPKRHLASSATDALLVMANHSIQARRIMSAQARSFTF